MGRSRFIKRSDKIVKILRDKQLIKVVTYMTNEIWLIRAVLMCMQDHLHPIADRSAGPNDTFSERVCA